MSEDIMSNISVCASCGIAEVDEVKLKECADCDLVRYCSDACQESHKSQHEEACKKRAVELRDELLFKQPESRHDGDCPICCLPMPLDLSKSVMMMCCSKLICGGCYYANKIREIQGRIEHKCPFCRKPTVATDEECDKQNMRRVEANDPVALRREGVVQYHKGDYIKEFEYYTKATELGDVEAHYNLSVLYDEGLGVEKDKGKEIYHLEEAAIGGHPYARFNLGCEEKENGNIEKAVKHWIISATQGHDKSIKALMGYFKEGKVSKDDLAAALRAHQAAVDATKSPQRDSAEKYYRIEDNSNIED
ncbi:hypothetical protein QTG54_014068 [Skeletonema marinoi]|uniref:MYND-type domain-containing protein n=1 Tax=Skeletonema marinoi TaxID=267567 RepID=A0AAD8XXJ1_9STRA|nr:hypothetical protein QTG54_014068 [Skeletonema marinoi]